MSWAVEEKYPVAWGEMDAYQHVNNAVYLRWFENVRILWLERVQFPEDPGRLGPVLRSASVEYQRAVKYPDTVTARVRVKDVGRSSVTLTYEVWSEKLKAVMATGETRVVLVDFEHDKSVPIPDDVRGRILATPPPATAPT